MSDKDERKRVPLPDPNNPKPPNPGDCPTVSPRIKDLMKALSAGEHIEVREGKMVLVDNETRKVKGQVQGLDVSLKHLTYLDQHIREWKGRCKHHNTTYDVTDGVVTVTCQGCGFVALMSPEAFEELRVAQQRLEAAKRVAAEQNSGPRPALYDPTNDPEGAEVADAYLALEEVLSQVQFQKPPAKVPVYERLEHFIHLKGDGMSPEQIAQFKEAWEKEIKQGAGTYQTVIVTDEATPEDLAYIHQHADEFFGAAEVEDTHKKNHFPPAEPNEHGQIIRMMPFEVNPRVETGALQFGDDWPGLFIRGDISLRLAVHLSQAVQDMDDLVKMVGANKIERAMARANFISLIELIIDHVIMNGQRFRALLKQDLPTELVEQGVEVLTKKLAEESDKDGD